MVSSISSPLREKKPEKHKDGPQKTSEKRQMEEQQQDEEPLPGSPAPEKKKHKKRKLEEEQHEPVKSAALSVNTSTEPTPAKKLKKRKSKQALGNAAATGPGAEVEQEQGAVNGTPATAADFVQPTPAKKAKKRKSEQALYHVAAADQVQREQLEAVDSAETLALKAGKPPTTKEARKRIREQTADWVATTKVASKVDQEQQEVVDLATTLASKSNEPMPVKKAKKRKSEYAVKNVAAAEPVDEIEQVNGTGNRHKKSKQDQGAAEDVGHAEELAQLAIDSSIPKEPKKKKRSANKEGTPLAQVNGPPIMQEQSFSLQSKKPLKGTKPTPNVETQPPALSQLSTSQIFPESQQSNPPDVVTFDNSLLFSHTPFTQQTVSFYLPLSPIAHNFPLEGLCAEHISPLLLTYFPPLCGVVLSYTNARLSEHPEQGAQVSSSKAARTVLSRSIDEYAVTYVWLTAEFTLFRPGKGKVLEGWVGLQNEGLLGLVCYNYFNAGVERARLPWSWRWTGDERAGSKVRRDQEEESGGSYVDGEGKKVEGRVLFRVKDFAAEAGGESGVGSINIYGTLLTEEDDRTVDDKEKQPSLGQANGSGLRLKS